MEENNFQKAIIKQLSHNLEDLESFIKDLWQFLPLPMAYLNPKQIILDANLSLGEFFGENPIDLIGQRGEIFFFNKKIFQKIYQEITEKKKILNFEGMVRTKKGKK